MNVSTLEKMAQMKLYGMLNHYKILMESRRGTQLTHDELVDMLVQAEWDDRQHRRFDRNHKRAKFRYAASIEEVDFVTNRGLDKTQFLRLADGEFIKQKQDLLITGLTGVGKSFLSTALGHQACLLGYHAMYFNAQKLFERLILMKADGSYAKEIKKIEKTDLLIIDDFGHQPLDAIRRMILMEILEDRHGRRSTVISSQLPVSNWYEIIGEATIADAILDRLVHHAHRIELKGESMRKKKI
jgi:DNA replication protein DnaC